VGLTVDDATRERLESLGYLGDTGGTVASEEELWAPGAPDAKTMIGVFNDMQRLPNLMLGGEAEAEARALIESLLERAPGNLTILRQIGRVQARAEDWAGLRQTCRRLLDREPDDGETWRTLARASWRLGEREEAIAALERTLELEPEEVELHVRLAEMREETGDAEGALRELDRALARDRASRTAILGKARLLSRAGRSREAAGVLREGLAALPDDVDVLNNLAWLLADRSLDPAAAYAHARRAAELAPDDPAVLDTLGWAAIRAGRPADGVAPLTRAWRETEDAEVRAHLGVALAETGRVEEGTAHVRAAVAERPALAAIPEVAKWSR
jgi:tetratricopeptide (TPR) repeat protein